MAETAKACGCPVTVCGEIGGRPLEAMALIGLGFRSLSMSPTSIGPVKAMLLALDAAGTRRRIALHEELAALRAAANTPAAMALLGSFAESPVGIPV